jgi:hypothetical protein
MDPKQRIQRLENWLSCIGDTLDRPIWDGQNFVYTDVTVKHVAYLKAVRAVSGLHALPVLYEHGLLIDGGTIVRCINEALSEIFFVLENYPTISSKVEAFIEHFLATQTGIDEKEAHPVTSRKIHSAEARIFEEQLNFTDSMKMIRNVYETFSGYVHGQYPHIMEIYGGRPENLKFSTGGVLTVEKQRFYTQLIDATTTSTELAIAFIAFKLGMNDLFLDIRQGLNVSD